MSDEQAAPSGDDGAPQRDDAVPRDEAASEQPSSSRRRITWFSIGGLALATLTVLAGIAQVSGFTLRDFADNTAAEPSRSPENVVAQPSTRPVASPAGDHSTEPSVIGSPSASTNTTASPNGRNLDNNGGVRQPTPTPILTTAPAPLPFRFELPAALPLCSDVGGTGTKPATGQALIFVQHAGQPVYFYERPVDYPSAGRWVSYTVRLGSPSDTGLFYLHVVRVDQAEADAIIRECVGKPCPYENRPPGTILATSDAVQRTAAMGSCSA